MDGAKPTLASSPHRQLPHPNVSSPQSVHVMNSLLLTVSLQDPQDLVPGDEPHLRDSVRVPEDDADLGGGETSSSELDDLLGDVFRGGLGPGRLGATVGEGGGGCEGRKEGVSVRSRRCAGTRKRGERRSCGGEDTYKYPFLERAFYITQSSNHPAIQ